MTMNRAEELREAGATVISGARTGGGGIAPTPFIKWPANAPPTAWVEGTVEEIWEGKYGENAAIIVTASSGGVTASRGTDSAVVYPFEAGVGERVNIGLASATLKDRVTEEHIGEVLHFEFLGWVEPANGNRYRNFEIQVVPEALRRPTVVYPEIVGSVVHGVTEDGGPVAKSPEDELPF
jgi:hypothetical protein